MKKIYLLFLLPFLFQELAVAQSANELPYQQTDLSNQERVKDLIGRMSLEEKVSQMMYNSPGIEQLDGDIESTRKHVDGIITGILGNKENTPIFNQRLKLYKE